MVQGSGGIRRGSGVGGEMEEVRVVCGEVE